MPDIVVIAGPNGVGKSITVVENPPTLLSEGVKIDKVFETAVKKALKRHKEAGNSIAIWRDGKVVILTPDQIKA